MSDDALRELYQEVILDHGRRPRNFRHPDDANRRAHGHNPMCGDSLVVYLTVDAEDRITDAAFQGKGCAISVASASLMTEIVHGKTVAEAERLIAGLHAVCTQDGANLDDVAAIDPEAAERMQALAGVRTFPMRVKCATLAWHTLDAAAHGTQEASTE